MTTVEPSGQGVSSPKIRNQSLVRKFVSQNSQGYVAIGITDGTAALDPDPNTLSLVVWFNDVTTDVPPADPRGTQIISVDAADIHRADTGKYDYSIGPEFTAYRGILTATWSYQINGNPFTYIDHLQILGQMPVYDSCSEAEKSVVEQVSWMLGDLFDSTEGGPYLIEPFQTHFDYERIAQLARISTTRMGYTGFPVMIWGFGSEGMELVTPPPAEFQGLSVIGTYLEVVRHLIRSYTEIPAFQAMNVTYADRRDYSQRWQAIYASEWPEYQSYVKLAKRKLLGLSHGSLLLAGGIYGGGSRSGLFLWSPYSAMTRAFRFYPAAAAISFGSYQH